MSTQFQFLSRFRFHFVNHTPVIFCYQFIDFKLADKDPIRLVGAPAACQMRLQRPNDGTASAQKLNEQTFLSGGANSNYGAMFANKITVDCP